MNRNEIEKLFYIEKDYSKIKEQLKDSSDSWSFNMLGRIALLEKDTDLAFEYFAKIQNIYGCAYSKFLAGNLLEAKILLCLIKNSSPASMWTYNLIEILNNNKKVYPTYFQIRNFYEQDLEMLFLYKQQDMIEKIINSNNILEQSNREIYKYTARILYNHKEYKQAEEYIKISLDISYNDPETHFILGDIYMAYNDIENAKKEYQKSTQVACGYLPAERKLKEINR